MAALAADRNTVSKYEGVIKSFPVKDNVIIYKGALVGIDSNGYALPAADAASVRVVGVAEKKADNTVVGHVAGFVNIQVRSGRAFRFNASSITQAMVGTIMYVVDDNTFDDAVGTNAIKAGRLVEYLSATEGWIYVHEGGMSVGTAVANASDLATAQALANALKVIINANVA